MNSQIQDVKTTKRGVSNTVGVTLILATILLSTGVILGVGGAIISESQSVSSQESMNHAMTQLDSQAGLVAFDGSSQQIVNLAAGGTEQVMVVPEGQIQLEVQQINETHPSETEVVATLLDEELHSIQYQRDEYVVSYQAGGVWSMQHDDESTAQLVSPPGFSYSENTATLPIVSVEENNRFVSSDGRITLSKATHETIYPRDGSDEFRNPVEGGNDLVLRIESVYYEAWGDYFESYLDLNPTFDHENNVVEVVLVPEGNSESITEGFTSVGGDRRVEIEGQGTETVIDSYTSSEGPYEESNHENGSISSETGVDMNNGVFRGDLITEGDVVLRGNSRITGDVTASGGVSSGGDSSIDGNVSGDANVESHRAIDRVIEVLRSDFESNNDNLDASRVSNGRITSERVLKLESGVSTVHAGEFYVSEIESDGGELEFDLSDGDVRMVVDESLELTDIDVVVNNTEDNENRVELYTRGNQVDVTDVSIEGDQAPSMWVYGGAGTEVTINGDATMVVYAPGTSEIHGELRITSQSAFFGAAVTGDTVIENQGSFHYDTTLRDVDVFVDEQQLSHSSGTVSYFHISYTEIDVE